VPTVSVVSEVHAPVKKVWEVLLEPAYIPRLYPDVLTVTVDPPGKTVVGQRFHMVGKAGRRKLEIFAETIELVPEEKTLTRQRPGGLFKEFEATIKLEPKGKSTIVETDFRYELSMGYLGKVFNMLLLERLVGDNLRSYARNLKEICELLSVADEA
jgi:hypothetical protein